jgi:hypothetical protein
MSERRAAAARCHPGIEYAEIPGDSAGGHLALLAALTGTTVDGVDLIAGALRVPARLSP